MVGQRHLTRRSDGYDQDTLHPLAQNEFWLQTQDVLLPYFHDLYDNDLYVPIELGNGHTLCNDIDDFLSMRSGARCLILSGEYGVGKTSALKYFFTHHLSQAHKCPAPVHAITIDGNAHAAILTDRAGLLRALANDTARFVANYLLSHGQSRDTFLADVYAHDDEFAADRLVAAPSTLDERHELLGSRMQSDLHRITLSLRFLKRATNGLVVLVLDNIDPLPPDVQLEAVRLATQLNASCDTHSLVAVRRSTRARLKYSDAFLIGNLAHTEVLPPPFVEVIRRRIRHALQSRAAQSATLGQGVLVARLVDSPEFAEVLANAFSAHYSVTVLRGLSNGSVREALKLAIGVYSSAYLDAKRIIRKLSPAEEIVPSLWRGHVPPHVIVRALTLGNRRVYVHQSSYVSNIFGTRCSHGVIGPFLRTLLLSRLRNVGDVGLVTESLVQEAMSVLGVDREEVELEVNWLLEHEWMHFIEPGRVAQSQRGACMIDTIIYDPEYLTHIAADADLPPALTKQLSVPAENLKSRLENVCLLLEYLVQAEEAMLREIAKRSLNAYVSVYGTDGITTVILSKVQRMLRQIDEIETRREQVVNDARMRLRQLQNDSKVQGLIAKYQSAEEQ